MDIRPIGYGSNKAVPISRLPLELLTHIFWLAIPNVHRNAFGRSISSTFTLCSVCSGWREIILGNPLFWSSIPIGNSKYSRDLTQLCLERSKDSLIDISACPYDKSNDAGWQGLQELVTHVHRIRSVDVFADFNKQFFSLMECILGDQVPASLNYLSIRIRDLYRYTIKLLSELNLGLHQVSFGTNLNKLYDQLHRLHLGNIRFSDWAQWQGCSFGQLKELVLNRNFADHEGLTHIIVAAANLQLLEFCSSIEWMADGAALKPVLRVGHGPRILRMYRVTYEAMRRAMERIIPVTWETELFVDLLFRFNERTLTLYNGSTVKALSLDNSKESYSGSSIRAILKAFPNLEILTLEKFDLTNSALSSITRPLELVETEFPRLSVLRLHSSRILDHYAFMAMVLSHPIRRLEIWSCELEWEGGSEPYVPTESSPLHAWLRSQVPDIHVVGH